MLEIRWSCDHLIFKMGIPIPGKDDLYIETGPDVLPSVCFYAFPCELFISFTSNLVDVFIMGFSQSSYWSFSGKKPLMSAIWLFKVWKLQPLKHVGYNQRAMYHWFLVVSVLQFFLRMYCKMQYTPNSIQTSWFCLVLVWYRAIYPLASGLLCWHRYDGPSSIGGTLKNMDETILWITSWWCNQNQTKHDETLGILYAIYFISWYRLSGLYCPME